MAAFDVLPNAPITEALLDIRATLPPSTDITALARLHDRIASRFPNQRPINQWEFGFQVKEGAVPSLTLPPGFQSGVMFLSADERKIVQAKLAGFTFNKLKPYETWQPLRDEARELWQDYCEVASPIQVSRVALRYINRIEMPLPVRELKDFVLTAPDIAPGIPQDLSHFFMRLVIPHPAKPITAVINQTIDPPVDGRPVLPLIFDIDVFTDSDLDPGSSQLWDTFGLLREFKNTIFFNSMTPKAMELFR